MKIYTRTGDEGQTSLLGGRVDKDHLRVEAYGTIDELNTFIGETIFRCSIETSMATIANHLTIIQHELFDIGADLALTAKNPTYQVQSVMTLRLEEWIDAYDQELDPLKRFILPGGGQVASALHICRVVTRRAERRVVSLCKQLETNVEVRRYLNRLSDLLFVMARVANMRMKINDIEYNREDDPTNDHSV